jgi:hypothetical protein
MTNAKANPIVTIANVTREFVDFIKDENRQERIDTANRTARYQAQAASIKANTHQEIERNNARAAQSQQQNVMFLWAGGMTIAAFLALSFSLTIS